MSVYCNCFIAQKELRERERELNSFVTRTTAADADAGTVISAVLITKTITLSLLFFPRSFPFGVVLVRERERERAVSNEQQS